MSLGILQATTANFHSNDTTQFNRLRPSYHIPFSVPLQTPNPNFALPTPASMAFQSPYIHVTFTIENQTSPDQNKRKRLVYYPSQAKPNQKPTQPLQIPISAPTKLQQNPSSKTQLQHNTDTGPSVPVYRYSLWTVCARLDILTTNLDISGCT
ncbi:hypothetical protein EAE99_000199 [Botrytis elliptica]|nr:hypothetical protein EAE99_000199 [Botrytis elliptica]